MVTLREKYPLESRKPLKKTVAKVWGFIPIFLFFILPIFIFLPLDALAVIGSKTMILVYIISAYILISLSIYVYEVFFMKHYFYDIIGDTIMIKKGVFSRDEISIPFNRLQDVHIDQDILDRIFGLYDVHVSSATFTSDWLAHIDGINKENSKTIKDLILTRINKHGEQ